MNNKAFSKTWILPVISILIVIVVIGGVFLYLKNWLGIEEKTPEQELSDEIDNWKTYVNEEYGFEVKYPETWYVGESGVGETVIATFPIDSQEEIENYGMITFDYRTDITIEKLLDTFQKMKERTLSNPSIKININKYEIKEITIGGLNGYIDYEDFVIEGKPPVMDINVLDINWILSDKNGKGFFQIMSTFNGQDKSNYAKTAEKMISTFRFLE